jgi:DNA transformation protein
MAMDTSEIDHLLELLEPFGPLTARRMFGGWGIYAGGPMVAIVIDGELLLKTDPATRAVFERAGCRPFVYRARGREVPMSYWSVPDAALDSAEAMQPWARLALEAGVRAAQAKPARSRTRKRGRT